MKGYGFGKCEHCNKMLEDSYEQYQHSRYCKGFMQLGKDSRKGLKKVK